MRLVIVTALQQVDDGCDVKLVPRLKPRSADFTSIDGSQDVVTSDEDTSLLGVTSGTGILEFSPVNAGLDVTPAHLEFSDSRVAESNSKAAAPPVLTALESELLKISLILDLELPTSRLLAKILNYSSISRL